MKLFKISQEVNKQTDTYDNAIVCAKDEKDAISMHPNGNDWDGTEKPYGEWCDIKYVQVEYIGLPKKGLKRGVICTSFNC